MSNKTVTLEEAISNYIDHHLFYSELNKYKDLYRSYTDLQKNYKKLMSGMGKKLVNNLMQENIIDFRTKNSRKMISVYSIAKYQKQLKIFLENYIEIKDALKLMGMQKNITTYAHLHRFIYLHENKLLNLTILNRPIFDKRKYYIEKNELNTFLNNHISLVKAAEIFNIDLSTLRQYWLKKYDGLVISFHHSNPNLCFVDKHEWNAFSAVKKKIGILSREEASNVLDLSAVNFERIAIEYGLKGEKFSSNLESHTYYNKKDINDLKKLQIKQIDSYKAKYYTNLQAADVLGTTTSKLHKFNLNFITAPPLICTKTNYFNLRKSGVRYLYLKEEVNKLKTKRDEKEEFESILYHLVDSPINIFNQLIVNKSIKFSPEAQQTKEKWFRFVKTKLMKSHASDNTLRKQIQTLFKSTQLLSKITLNKEIYFFQTNELLLSIFNSNITKGVQTELYQFLNKLKKQVTEENKINYNVRMLPNPYAPQLTHNDKTIYDLNEYLSLLNYVQDANFHKTRALMDVDNQVNKARDKERNKTYHYDSVWLYILLHMNNAWRHSDVTLFPRISLRNTRIQNMDPLIAIDWLKHYDLNSNEVDTIVNQVKALPLVHSKTKKKRHFICSEELKNAFAHASVICELRTQIIKPFANSIIDLDNRKRILKSSHEKYFFNSLSYDFLFKSKQMNRTVISLAYSVIKKTTNRTPLEITKHFRSHASEETTNIYIDIPQKQIDYITKQLFDVGNFGYIYDSLNYLLTGESNNEPGDKNSKMIKIKETFGDAFKIEGTTRYLNRLSEDQDMVKKIINGLSDQERLNLSNTIKLGQQPAKKEGFQCIYKTCYYPSRDCIKCPFSIPNFHALSQLCSDIDHFLKKYKSKFHVNQKEGERIHLANTLYSYLKLLKQAIDRFGQECISNFFENGLSKFKEELSELPSSRELITIEFNNEGM